MDGGGWEGGTEHTTPREPAGPVLLGIVGTLCLLLIVGWNRFGFGSAARAMLRAWGEFSVVLITEAGRGKEVTLPASELQGIPVSLPKPFSIAAIVKTAPTTGTPASLIIDSAAAVSPIVALIEPVASPAQSAGELPIKIVIADASVSSSVSNPRSQAISVLDQALLSGALRYPTSALLGVPGTVLIFGHSSYLQNVHNPAYRTFDGVQNLSKGAIIQIYSADAEYRYAVRSIRVVNVNDDTENNIPLPSDAPHLVIVTCDTFASASDRFVLDADFVGERPL